jgi:hypothetical protein
MNEKTDFAEMKRASEEAAAAQAREATIAAQAEMQPRDPGMESINAPSDHSENPGLVAITPEDLAEHRAKIGPSRGALVAMPHGDEREATLLAATKEASHRRVSDDGELESALKKAVAGVIHKRRRARNGKPGNSAIKS